MTFWTDRRVAELKIRWDINGESATQICLAMNAPSRGAVIAKARRLNLAVRATKHSNGARRPAGFKRRRAIASPVKSTPSPSYFKNPKTLLALRRGECRWPGTGCGGELLFCAAPAVEGRPYCPDHCRRAYAVREVQK